jgi:hypothetical protein
MVSTIDEVMRRRLVAPFIRRTNHTIGNLTEMLRCGDATNHLARFGDGEIFCCMSEHRLVHFEGNADGHPYSASLAASLVDALESFVRHDGVWLGNWHYWPFGAWLHGMVDSFGGKSDWFPHNAMCHVDGKALVPIRDFYRAIRDSSRRKVLLARGQLRPLRKFFGNCRYIEAPSRNGWADYPAVLERMVDTVTDGDLVLLAFGMPAKPLMAELLRIRPVATYLDVGSGMDPMVRGRRTRRHQPSWEVMNQLYGGELHACL